MQETLSLEDDKARDLLQRSEALTVDELQRVLRIGRATAYRLVNGAPLNGRTLYVTRIGRAIRIPTRELRRALGYSE